MRSARAAEPEQPLMDHASAHLSLPCCCCRDWGADESEGEEKDDEEGAGVLLGELSGGEDSESSGSQGGESDSD